MYTFTYPAGLSSFGLTIPSDSIAFANKAAGTSSDNDFFKSIRREYAKIEAQYQAHRDKLQSNKFYANKMQKLIKNLGNIVNLTLEDLKPLTQVPQLQEQLTEEEYYNLPEASETERKLSEISAEVRAMMAQAGIAVTEVTDTAIANMIKIIGQLNPKQRDRLFADMKLRDILKFENITSLLSLDDSEDRLKNISYDTLIALLGLTKEADEEKTERQQEIMDSARAEIFGIDPEDKDLTLKSILDYAYRLAVAVNSTDTSVAEPTQEQLDEELKLIFAYLYPTQDSEVLLNKYKSMLTRGELGVAELLTKEEFGREDVYVTEDGKPSEGYIKVIKSKTYEQLMGVTKIGNSASKDSLRAFRIVYDGAGSEHNIDIAGHYGEMVSFFKTQGLTKEQAQALTQTFTIGELSDVTFRSGLKKVVREGLITINTQTSRQGIIDSVKVFTNEQLRRKDINISDISSLLIMAELDAEQIQRNENAITLWMSDSEVVRTFGEKLRFEYEVNMENLAKPSFVKDNLRQQNYTEVLKNQYGNMTYNRYTDTQVSSELSLKDTRIFFGLLGLDYDNVIKAYNGLREYVRAEGIEGIQIIVADKMADRAMEIKEFNEEVAKQTGDVLDNFAGSATIEQLSNPKYVEEIEILTNRGVITTEDIASGMAIEDIIKGKALGEVRNVLGTEYSAAMAVFGLENIVENTKRLEEKYTSDVEKAVISEMSISELMNVEPLMNNSDEMKTRVRSFGDTLTMNIAREIATREGLNIAGIVNGATRYLGYALYDKRVEALSKEGIETGDIPIKAIIDNNRVLEEVRGLKSLGGMDAKSIADIIKKSGGANKTITDTIKGKSIKEFRILIEGMTDEQKNKLYNYLGLNRKAIEKKINGLRSGLEVPEELALEQLTIGETDSNEEKTLIRDANTRVEDINYKGLKLLDYKELSEFDKAKYGADKVKIETRLTEIGNFVSGGDAILVKYIVEDMSVRDLLRENVAENRIKTVMNNKVMRNRYYNKMRAEDFMKATEVKTEDEVDKKKTEEKRRDILGDKYEMFMKNYKDLMADVRFGEAVKAVRVEVLSSDMAEKTLENAIKDQRFTREQAEKLVIVIEESKEEEGRKREALEKNIKPVLEEVQGERGEALKAKDCIDAAVDTMSKIIPLKPLTEAAVQANPYAQDDLLAAGVGEGLEGTRLGELRRRTGLKYATIDKNLEDVSTEFVAYMLEPGSKVGHAITVIEVEPESGKIYYADEKHDRNGMFIEEFERQFSGLILAPEGAEGVYYLDSETRGIVSDMYKKSGVYEGVKSKNKISKFKEGEKLMGEIINGVTRPKELIQTVAAALALYKDSDAMAKAMGFNSIEEAKAQGVEGITQKYYEKIGQLLNMEVTNRADLQASIDILSTVRDMLIMAVKDERMEQMLNDKNTKSEDLTDMLIVSKAVNQNVLIKGMNSATTKVSADFVIDVTKLQKAVATKIDSRDKAGIIKDIADSLRLGRGQGRDKMPKMLMALSDIHAIAAAA